MNALLAILAFAALIIFGGILTFWLRFHREEAKMRGYRKTADEFDGKKRSFGP